MSSVRKTWCIERWDATWGGWRKMSKSFADDSVATFARKRDAEEALAELRAKSGYRYRVSEVRSGE